MSEPPTDIGARKSDHLDLAISGDVGFRRTTLFEQVTLIHSALPELSLGEVDLKTSVAGLSLRSPLMISSMTGGNRQTGQINQKLAELAETGRYALGLGSQRAMIKKGRLDPQAGESYRLRHLAPTIPIFGNLGAVQASTMPTTLVEEMLRFVDANGIFIHLNPAQELVQPEGDRSFVGCLAGIGRLARDLSVPVIVKETGCGISRAVASRLAAEGVSHIEVAGAGGTSWVAVEARRSEKTNTKNHKGELFWDWGIPSAASVLQVAEASFRTVIASGGIKTGLDVAKAIALGAHAVGIARPVIQALDAGGVAGALSYLQEVEDDLRTALLLTGSKNLPALRKVPKHLGAELRSWSRV